MKKLVTIATFLLICSAPAFAQQKPNKQQQARQQQARPATRTPQRAPVGQGHVPARGPAPVRTPVLGMGEALRKAISALTIATRLDILRHRTSTQTMISGLVITLVETIPTIIWIIPSSMGVSRAKSVVARSTGLRAERGTVFGSGASTSASHRMTTTLPTAGSGTLTTS